MTFVADGLHCGVWRLPHRLMLRRATSACEDLGDRELAPLFEVCRALRRVHKLYGVAEVTGDLDAQRTLLFHLSHHCSVTRFLVVKAAARQHHALFSVDDGDL